MYIKPTFNSLSFGCRVNEAEKVVIDSQLMKAGFLQNSLNPDFFIINSCAVTAKAERETRQLILKLKRENPKLKLIVTGCAATYWLKNRFWQSIPIDLIISSIDKEYAVRLILKRFFPERASQSTLHEPTRLGGLLLQQDKFLSSGRVMIKIQDGCHRFCSYCIVPYLRGAPRSKTIADIIKEVKNYEATVSEVIYTAINTESFGMDKGESLPELIVQSINRLDIPRISFGSIHPWSINDEFIALYKKLTKNPRFSSFFHIPLQSGSNKILNLMKRDYMIEDIIEKLIQIQKINPLALIATDIIVGFLDETDKDFEDTYKLLESSPINKFHVFRFSPRQNTAAIYMKKRLKEPAPQEKMKRAKALISLSQKKYRLFMQKQVGQIGEGLFIGEMKEGYQQAILENQIPVWVKTDTNLKASIQKVKVLEYKKNVLTGRVVTRQSNV